MEVKTFIGKVKSLHKSKAYGHLTPSWAINDDDNIFFHFSRTVPKKCFLEKGKEVLFQLERDSKGRWMAIELLDVEYASTETINRAKMMKSRPDFLPDSFMLREDRQKVKKVEAQVDRAKKDEIINQMESDNPEEILDDLITSKEVKE